jgi:hypothetical protein
VPLHRCSVIILTFLTMSSWEENDPLQTFFLFIHSRSSHHRFYRILRCKFLEFKPHLQCSPP